VTSQLTLLNSSVQVRGAIVTVRGSPAATGDHVDDDDDDDDGGSDSGGGGSRYDFGSRYFAPWVGIDEDPVTGRYIVIATDHQHRLAETLTNFYFRLIMGFLMTISDI